MDLGKMCRKEISRLEGIIETRKATHELCLSKRQMIRLMKRYRQGGTVEIMHRIRGKASHKRIAESQRQSVIKLIYNYYRVFSQLYNSWKDKAYVLAEIRRLMRGGNLASPQTKRV